MLYPQANQHRDASRLADFWDFRFDSEDVGVTEGWHEGFDSERLAAVPASWNDLFADGRDNLGPAWYQLRFRSSPATEERWRAIRFDSVSYQADVWVNGHKVGSHRGAHLPFECPINAALQPGENLLVVRVDGRLDLTTVPGGPPARPKGTGTPEGSMMARLAGFMGSMPRSNFDFFPYAGIQRPVYLLDLPAAGIATVAVDTAMDGTAALTATVRGDVDSIRASIGHDAQIEAAVTDRCAQAKLQLREPALWGIGQPNLYSLQIEAIANGEVVDTYELQIGFRTIETKGHQILLNGEPIEIRGFGRHEDFPIHGRGYNPAVMIKDFSLMDWVGANSFRTSHYPYSEEQLQLADRLGVLVISESPAVSFRFNDDDGLDARLEQWRSDLDQLVARDRNHPSVIMWSVGNEPMDFAPEAAGHIEEMLERVRSLDGTRPVSIDSPLSHRDEAFASSDIICLHDYPGWYSDQGNLELGVSHTRAKVQSLASLGKPVLITEIGADTLAGHHAQPPEMFSEEYQAELIEKVLDLVEELDELAGVQWWNLCDFKTAQGVLRPKALNHKGLFTRERRPKLAAHRLRDRWTA